MDVLLHICCAPDGTVPLEFFIAEKVRAAGYFYGGNIHPQAEYERRACAVRALGCRMDVPMFYGPYCPDEWVARTISLKCAPEGGARCGLCFALQLEGAALEAVRLGCRRLCTTLTISPHKRPELINRIGRGLAARHGLVWDERIWRKGGGFALSVAMSREMGLYRQNYCGCVYSMPSNCGFI